MAHLFRIWLWVWRGCAGMTGGASGKACENRPAFAGKAPRQARVVGHVEEAHHARLITRESAVRQDAGSGRGGVTGHARRVSPLTHGTSRQGDG